MTIKAVCGPASTATTERWDSALAVGATRLSIAQSLRELCQPPYGANIASAGLLLGVFVAPRSEKLVVVRDGQQLPLSEWLQDGVFRGRFIDLNAIHGVDLVLVGESSSEWETLLDEWEQAESYLEREQYLHRAASLMGRVPVPPAIGYRKMHLEGLAQDAGQKLEQLNRELNDSITKLHSGEQRGDVGLLGWGAASLHDLGGKMASERPFWTDQQIAEVQPHVERARQAIIQLFPEWKQHQVSANGSPSAVGAFQHKMLRQVGVSLRKLDLGNLYGELETYTNQIVRNAEVAAGASQLIRDVESWLQSHRDASRVVRITENRALRDIGKEYSTKLQSMSVKAKAAGINMTELGEMRTQLVSFLGVLKEANSAVVRGYQEAGELFGRMV